MLPDQEQSRRATTERKVPASPRRSRHWLMALGLTTLAGLSWAGVVYQYDKNQHRSASGWAVSYAPLSEIPSEDSPQVTNRILMPRDKQGMILIPNGDKLEPTNIFPEMVFTPTFGLGLAIRNLDGRIVDQDLATTPSDQAPNPSYLIFSQRLGSFPIDVPFITRYKGVLVKVDLRPEGPNKLDLSFGEVAHN